MNLLSTEAGIDILILAAELMETIKRPVVAVTSDDGLDKTMSQPLSQVIEEQPAIPQW